MQILALVSLAVTLVAAQDFAFNLQALGKQPMTGGLRAEPVQHHVAEHEIHQSLVHKFTQSSLRTFKVIGQGRFRTFKQTSGDVKQNRDDIVYLSPASEVECPSETTVEEVVIEVVVEEEEQGVLETIAENVRNAFDEYISPILGGNITSGTIAEAARGALDWINQRIWGSKLARSLKGRIGVVKIDSDTGDALVFSSDNVDVQVIRIDEVVYDAAEQAVAETDGLKVGHFRFEAGDFILIARRAFLEAVGQEQILKALSFEHKTLSAKADALVKAAPKVITEESFLLSVFE